VPPGCVASAAVERCTECGFVYGDLPRAAVAGALRTVAAQYRSRLVGVPLDRVRQRPTPDVWSPLEYAAHVRDVLAEQRRRAGRALDEDLPRWGTMRPEALVTERGYNHDDPGAVVDTLEANAEALAGFLEALDEEGWARQGIYNWPTEQPRDLVWLGRHTVHELVHHLLDVTRGLDATPIRASG
jgi:S-DNA-T family DNA segregation ATPase FtsK/SpoIIIE